MMSYEPGSKLVVLGMVIPPLMTGILIMGPYKPLRTWVDEFIPYYMEIMGVDRPDRTYGTLTSTTFRSQTTRLQIDGMNFSMSPCTVEQDIPGKPWRWAAAVNFVMQMGCTQATQT